MKILFYNHTGQVSGAERLLLMILSRLDRKSFEPIVVCPAQGPLLKMAAAAGVRAEAMHVLEARFTWRADRLVRYSKSLVHVVREFRRKVISLSPDLIHANSIRAGLVATAATFDLGTPVVWHLHDLLPRHPFSTAIRIFAALSGRSRMIAISEAVAKNFRGRFARLMKNRVSVILNAIELDKFQPPQTAGQTIRDGLGLKGAGPVLGIVGQLTPRKGQLELLRAFAQSLAELPRAVLLIVGAPLFNRDHEYADLLKRETDKLGIANRVLMLGPRSDVVAIMQALDLLVINSSAEPFGLVALEAMACGTAVLAAAVDGIPEIIEHGKNGWLVSRGDERMLAEAIVNLCTQPALRERIAEEGKRNVAAHFSADGYMKELQSFYHSAADFKSKAVAAEPTGRQAEVARFA
jgi:glycosyltransferase involved in cell wall biosynthesis